MHGAAGAGGLPSPRAAAGLTAVPLDTLAQAPACGDSCTGLWNAAFLPPGMPHPAPTCPSLYLLVRQEPSTSITGRDVKFSLAMSSIPLLLWAGQQVEQGGGGGAAG